jgi:hypothetical protein
VPIALIAVAAASVASSAIAAHAAGSAADAQSNAAKSAAQLEAESAANALAFQKEQWATQQKNIAPWLQAGQGGISQLSQLLGVGNNTSGASYGSLMQPWTEQFQAPTNVTEQNDPGYQFRLQEGQKALENSAAARGSLLTGGTAKGLQQYGQNYASNEYSNVYNRALGEYQQRYNVFEQNQANQFNRLASLSGAGQTAATTLGNQGQAAAGNISNILMNSAAQQGQALQNAGAARASGYVGGANAISGGINNLSSLLMMQQLMNSQGGGSAGYQPWGE